MNYKNPFFLSVIGLLILIACTSETTPSTPKILPSTESVTATSLVIQPTQTLTPAPQNIFEPVSYALTQLEVPRFRILQSFPGIQSFHFEPPTSSIAAGPDRIILMHDDGAEIRTKTGEIISGSDLITLFQNEFTDPRVVYDWYEEKFILLGWGFTHYPPDPDCQPGDCGADIYISISKDSSPDTFTNEDWISYQIDGTLQDNQPLALFPDWTMLGFDETYIAITAHRIRFSSARPDALTHENIGDKIWLIEKGSLGNERQLTNWIEYAELVDPQLEEADPFSEKRPFNLYPALHLTNTQTFFLASQAGSKCGITVWGIEEDESIHVEIANASGTCKGAPPALQPGNFPPLKMANTPKILVAPIYNHGSLWVVHNISRAINGQVVSAIRWVEIDVSNWPNDVKIIQEGIIEEANTWLMYPIIMVNQNNDMMMLYAKSSIEIFPSLYYTGRLSTDPLNTTRAEAVLKLGNASINLPSQYENDVVYYGRYFGISLDPVDGTVWVSGEYGGYENLHATWVGQLDWDTILPVAPIAEQGEFISPDMSFEIASAEFITRDTIDYADYIKKGINIKLRLMDLDTGSLPEEQLRSNYFCDACNGWTYVGYEEGHTVVIVYFDYLRTGNNIITIQAHDIKKEITVAYDPTIHLVR